MVFVGNAHCIQIHTGPVCNLKWLDDWFNVIRNSTCTLKTTDIAELWRVRNEHRWHRNQLGGLRRRRRTDRATVRRAQSRRAERDDWRELAESFKAL